MSRRARLPPALIGASYVGHITVRNSAVSSAAHVGSELASVYAASNGVKGTGSAVRGPDAPVAGKQGLAEAEAQARVGETSVRAESTLGGWDEAGKSTGAEATGLEGGDGGVLLPLSSAGAKANGHAKGSLVEAEQQPHGLGAKGSVAGGDNAPPGPGMGNGPAEHDTEEAVSVWTAGDESMDPAALAGVPEGDGGIKRRAFWSGPARPSGVLSSGSLGQHRAGFAGIAHGGVIDGITLQRRSSLDSGSLASVISNAPSEVQWMGTGDEWSRGVNALFGLAWLHLLA